LDGRPLRVRAAEQLAHLGRAEEQLPANGVGEHAPRRRAVAGESERHARAAARSGRTIAVLERGHHPSRVQGRGCDRRRVRQRSAVWVDLPGDKFYGHTDSHVVRLKDGSFAALKSTFTFTTPPTNQPWQQLKIREIRSPYPVEKYGRAAATVWRGSGNRLTWTRQGAIDVFKLAYQYPRPLDCDGVVRDSLAKQCQTKTKEEDLWLCAGLDRPEFYACPFTGYLYATMAYFSGPYEQHPYQHDHMLVCSIDKGVTWQVINDALGGPAPHGRSHPRHRERQESVGPPARSACLGDPATDVHSRNLPSQHGQELEPRAHRP
jgi:hypothetical protein